MVCVTCKNFDIDEIEKKKKKKKISSILPPTAVLFVFCLSLFVHCFVCIVYNVCTSGEVLSASKMIYRPAPSPRGRFCY